MKKITLDEVLDDDIMRAVAHEYIKTRIDLIRSGQVIRVPYARRTINKRKKYGLQTNHVDLTGSTSYSKKGWRLLNRIKVLDVTATSATIGFDDPEAEELYGYLVKRYGNFL